MIVEELKHIISKTKPGQQSNLYIRSILKEYLQTYVLNFIYLNPEYNKNFIFTGGTCLRRCFGLNRLSEDLDFDLEHQIDPEKLKQELTDYFRTTYLYPDVEISVPQKGKQVLLKFPVLKTLQLATGSESDLLYVKIDLSSVVSSIYQKYTTLNSVNDFNYIVTHYDLPSLMSNKITAILTRNRYEGKENIEIVKGRDYFDLLWFLDKKVMPNIPRLNDLLKSKDTVSDIVRLLDEKILSAVTTYKSVIERDLLPFIDSPQLVQGYMEGYKQNYDLKKKYLLG